MFDIFNSFLFVLKLSIPNVQLDDGQFCSITSRIDVHPLQNYLRIGKSYNLTTTLHFKYLEFIPIFFV